MARRILFWSPLYWPVIGGIEIFSRRLISGLRARGYDFAVLTSCGPQSQSDYSRIDGVPVHRFPFLTALAENDSRTLFAVLRGVAALKKEWRPDLVHLIFGNPAICFYHLKSSGAQPPPTLVTLVMNLAGVDPAPGSALRETLGKADWLASDSRATREEALRICPEIAGRSSLIHNGVHVPSGEPSPPDPNRPHLVCLGRLSKEKGFDLALAAFAQALKDFPSARLTIAGDGPAREQLEAQARELGVGEAVRFTGWLDPDRVPSLIYSAWAVVVPSRCADSLPAVVLEAARQARPVVGTRAGGLSEMVVHGETGWLFEIEDMSGLLAGMKRLLADPGFVRSLGLAARERILRLFSWDDCLNAYDRLYGRLLATRTK